MTWADANLDTIMIFSTTCHMEFIMMSWQMNMKSVAFLYLVQGEMNLKSELGPMVRDRPAVN